MQIAIDGPAGSGKSTVARKIAKKLKFLYLDTGAMYRAVALECLEKKISFREGHELSRLLENMDLYFENDQLFVNGKNVTDAIRLPDLHEAASMVAQMPSVRRALVKRQQDLARCQNVVMDGRDIGTCVLPQAQVKFFLTASLQERAKRRCLELSFANHHVDIKKIEKSLSERDYRDTHREHSPLKKANDAIELDTTNLSIDEVITKILNQVEKVSKDGGHCEGSH